MWSSMLSCCNDCLLGVQPDPHGKQLVSQKAAVGRGSYATAATDNRRSVSWVDEGHQRDEEDEDEHLRSKLVLKNRRSSSTVSKKNNEDPFKNVGRNKVKRQSVQSRADSSSDTDTSSVLPTPKSSMGSLNTADGGTSRGQGHRKPLRDDRDAPGASTPPAARTIAVAQQPSENFGNTFYSHESVGYRFVGLY